MSSDNLKKKASNKTFPGFERESNELWKGSFYFIQGADTQLGMAATFENRSGWEKEIVLTTKAIDLVNHMTPKPKFFIVCGDLVDAMPGVKFRNEQERDFVELFKNLTDEVPLICLCGNHDVGDKPTPEAIKHYKDKFGDDYFTFYYNGVMFIVLNSQYFEDSSLVQDLANEQEAWLEAQLQEAKSGKFQHAIIFQHIPWFLHDPDEDKEYFNIMPELRLKMLQKFYDANIRTIFCGHYHRNAGGFYNQDLELVVTSAIGQQLGKDKSGFRIVKVEEERIKHYYLPFADAPKNIILR